MTPKTRIYINNRDLLTTTRQLVTDARRFGGEPVIVDNASTYPPLLDWYAAEPCPIIRRENCGMRSAFQVADRSRPFVITDCDLDLSAVPDDLLSVLDRALAENPTFAKAGTSLRIDDLPDTPVAEHARREEAKNWCTMAAPGFYVSEIDTTFALYRPGLPFAYGPALRAAPPYCARHAPWYWTKGSMPQDAEHYLTHAEHLPGLVYTPILKKNNLP